VTDEVQDWIATYYEQSMEFLKMIRNCEMVLVDADSTVLSVWDMIKSNTQDSEMIFNLGKLYDQDYHELLTTGAEDARYGEQL